MKVITAYEEHETSYIEQYALQIRHLGGQYKAVEIKAQHLSWLQKVTGYIEPDFSIQIHKEAAYLEQAILGEKSVILAVIGVEFEQNEAVDAVYHFDDHKLTELAKPEDHKPYTLIQCVSKKNSINAVSYIRCIDALCCFSQQQNKPIVIYANIHIPDEAYRYRSLTSKIINTYLSKIDGVLVIKTTQKDFHYYYSPGHSPYEFYADQALYLQDTFSEALRKVLMFLDTPKAPARFKKVYGLNRQVTPLYSDLFYNSISPGTEIFIVLNLANFKRPEYYEALGFEVVRLVGEYGMLYGRKEQFDALSELLKSDVVAEYRLTVLSYPSCYQMQSVQVANSHLMMNPSQYRGAGVYIGIITTDDVDYTNMVLRNPDATSRIACIWHQVRGGTGTYYLKDQINSALENPNPAAVIPLPEHESVSTMMLGIAGGRGENGTYNALATESEFLVAKLQTASEELQRIYGGNPIKEACMLPEIIVGMSKLIGFAAQQGKPLVLCIPFNGNIDSHDGSLILQRIMTEIARTPGVTIIVPAGEEADKQHHYSLHGRQETLGPINIDVRQSAQSVVGAMYQKYPTLLSAFLIPPRGTVGDSVNLRQKGMAQVGAAAIFCDGESIDFLNGARRILFRIENPEVGQWQIQGEVRANIESQIDLWITQEELNPYITLSPANTFMTAGSVANVNNIMAVGAYDQRNMIVLRSSGRGMTWDNRVTPVFVTHASGILAPCGRGIWTSASGTLPAAAIMMGVTACLYSKFVREGVMPLPNTVVMNTTILSTVRQFESISYPNPSQGYGVFETGMLGELLGAPQLL